MDAFYTTRYCRVDDRISLITRLPDLMSLLDETIMDLCHILALEPPEDASLPLIIKGQGYSEVLDDAIIVVPKEDSRLKLRDWFELLFRHESTHWLVKRAWGQSMVLFWEGLPMYLADNVIRKRVLGFSYHAYCAALLKHGALLHLSAGLLPHLYYGMTHDTRITAEYGSFTGYLIEQYGIQSVQRAYQRYVPPTPERPVLDLSQLFQPVWVKDLEQLEDEWRVFLAEAKHGSADAEALVRKRQFSEHVALKDRHCRFCCTPTGNRAVCPNCHASQDIEITVISRTTNE